MAEGKSDIRTLSRRQFLLTAGVGLATIATTACEPIYIAQPYTTETHPPPAPPLEGSNAAKLQATATTLRANGEQTSLAKEGSFSKELLERARRSTVKLELSGEKGASRQTAWIAEKRGDIYYVAFTRHGLKEAGRGIKGISLWRPGIDQSRFTPKVLNMTYVEQGPDLAMIKCQGAFASSSPLEAAPWQDNKILTPGEELLVVGFPEDFRTATLSDNYYAMGSAVKVEDFNSSTQEWRAFGLVNGGSSGSPAFISNNGELLTVGTVASKREGGPDSLPEIVGTTLVVRRLLEAVR